MKKLVFVLLVIATAVVIWKNPLGLFRGGRDASAAPLSTSFTVINNLTTSYRIDGVDNPTLSLNMGSTYLFNVNAIGHPFDIKTVRVTGTGSRFANGVTGNGVQQGTLTFVVPMDAPATLFYQCEVHSAMGGTLNILGPLDAGDGIPPLISLSQAMPNPARNGSSFRVGLPRDARVDVAMFDSQGRLIRTLWSGTMTAGNHTIKWDGRDESQRTAPSGSYFYRLRVEGHQLTGRLTVAR